MAESPVVPGVLWAGTDDGNVQVSQDGGLTWTEVGKNIPGVNHEYYVSGLEASWYDAGTAYVALDGHRNDDLKPYIFKTTDYGQTWKAIARQPAGVRQRELDPPGSGEPQPALRADGVRLLHLARRRRALESRSCRTCRRAASTKCSCIRAINDLILATHSRSIWIMDDITALQHMTPDTMAQGRRRLRAARRGAVEGRSARTRPKCPATSGGRAKSRRAARRSPTT